jgi:hypothetical protein
MGVTMLKKESGYCESCGTEDVPVTNYEDRFEPRDLCDICATTVIASLTRQNASPDLGRAIAQVTHLILAEIRKSAAPDLREDEPKARPGELCDPEPDHQPKPQERK